MKKSPWRNKLSIKSFVKNLTLFDAIGLGLLFLLAGLFFTFFHRKTVFLNITVRAIEKETVYPIYGQAYPNHLLSQAFFVGQTEKNDFGDVVAEVTDINSFPVDEERDAVYLHIRLKSYFNPLKGTYSAKGRDIVVGETVSFNFSSAKVDGVVIDLEDDSQKTNEEYGEAVVEARLLYNQSDSTEIKGVQDYIAQAVKSGEVMKSADGTELARVEEVHIKPAPRTVVTATGETKVVPDPYLKDVTYVLRLRVHKIGGKSYVLNYVPFEVNRFLPLSFDQIMVFPTVTKIISFKPRTS